MSALVKNALASMMALLPRVTDAPAEPFGYGTDIWCERELDPSLDVDGTSTLALAQALMRRLDCPRGQLIDDPDYGLDLRAELNKGTTKRETEALASRIKLELTKDDRVESAKVTVAPNPDGSMLRISIRVTPADARGPFTMTLAVTSADVVLEAISEAA